MKKDDKTSFHLGNYKHLSNHLIPYALIPVNYELSKLHMFWKFTKCK